jgi:hypothetical protein
MLKIFWYRGSLGYCIYISTLLFRMRKLKHWNLFPTYSIPHCIDMEQGFVYSHMDHARLQTVVHIPRAVRKTVEQLRWLLTV